MKSFALILSLICLISCTNTDNDLQTETTIYGTWKLIETYDGWEGWKPVSQVNRAEISFLNNGIYASSHSEVCLQQADFLIIDIFLVLEFKNCDVPFNLQYSEDFVNSIEYEITDYTAIYKHEIINNQLLLRPEFFTSPHGTAQKYIKVNSQ